MGGKGPEVEKVLETRINTGYYHLCLVLTTTCAKWQKSSPTLSARSFCPLCHTGGMSVIFLSGPIGAGKTAVAKALVTLLPPPLVYIEGDTFWSFIRKDGERSLGDNFPVLVRSMTAAALPFARSGFRVLIDFSIPPTFLESARKILKEVPYDFVLLRPNFEVCAQRAASRQEGAIRDTAMLRNFYTRFEQGTVEAICDDTTDPESLARRIADGLNQGRFRVA